MQNKLTIEQTILAAKIKGLAKVLADYVVVIDDSQDPETVNEAVQAVEYYYRNYFKQSS